MRIFDSRGNRIGIVTGNLSLHSNDPALRSAWETVEGKILHPSDDVEIGLQKYLEDKGYRVE